jgi:hypothetical protein
VVRKSTNFFKKVAVTDLCIPRRRNAGSVFCGADRESILSHQFTPGKTLGKTRILFAACGMVLRRKQHSLLMS